MRHLNRSRKILPRCRGRRHQGLSAQLAFRAHLARDPVTSGGEGAAMIHHGLMASFHCRIFAAHVDRVFFERSPLATGDGTLRNVADSAP